MSYDQVAGNSGGNNASSSIVVTVGGSSRGGGICGSVGVGSSIGSIGTKDARRSGGGGGKSPRCC